VEHYRAWIKPSASIPRKYVSYFDQKIGLGILIICSEMILFALLWFWLYSPHSVIVRSAPGQPEAALPARVGTGSALLEALNILDLVRGSITAFTGKHWNRNRRAYAEKHVSLKSSAERSTFGGVVTV
jgi:hypothetical protein